MRDICISGAGLAGMTLAVALAKLGVNISLIDRQAIDDISSPEADPRTTAISWTTKSLLERLDLWQPIARLVTPIKAMLVTGQCGVNLRFDPADIGLSETGYIVPNTELRRVLIQRILDTPEIDFLTGRTLTDFNSTVSHVSCKLDSHEVLDFKLLVACDGQGSLIAKRLAKAPFKRTYGQTAFVTNLELDRPHGNVAFQVFAKTGPIALLPLPDTEDGTPRASLIWSHNQAGANDFTTLDPADFIALLNRQIGADFAHALALEGVVKSFPLTARFVTDVYQGRVVLLGEAAHNLHPLAGQGFNLTARDIGTLFDELKAARSLGLKTGSAVSLATYQKRRTADSAKMLTVVDTLDAMLGGDKRLPGPLRSLGFALVDQNDDLRKRLIREAMGFTNDLPSPMR